MNEEAQKLLDQILKKNPEDLTEEERTFLNARESYLNNEQRRIFASVLKSEAVLPKVNRFKKSIVA